MSSLGGGIYLRLDVMTVNTLQYVELKSARSQSRGWTCGFSLTAAAVETCRCRHVFLCPFFCSAQEGIVPVLNAAHNVLIGCFSTCWNTTLHSFESLKQDSNSDIWNQAVQHIMVAVFCSSISQENCSKSLSGRGFIVLISEGVGGSYSTCANQHTLSAECLGHTEQTHHYW